MQKQKRMRKESHLILLQIKQHAIKNGAIIFIRLHPMFRVLKNI